MIQYLSDNSIAANARIVDGDIAELTNLGFDIICNKSTQNRYVIGSRVFKKMLIDAIQVAQFIPDI